MPNAAYQFIAYFMEILKSENAKPSLHKWATNVIYFQSRLKYPVYSSLPPSLAAPGRLIRSSRAALRLSPSAEKVNV